VAASDRPLLTAIPAVMARPVTITLNNVTLKAAIKALAECAHADIQFRAEWITAVERAVTLHAAQMPLGVALEQVLRGTGFQADALSSGMINITAVGVDPVVASAGQIVGTVVDTKTKKPVRGALVVLDEAKTGVTTSDTGTFRMTGIPAGSHVIHVRKLGYAKSSQRVTVVDGAVASLSVGLESSANALDAVVVTGTVVPTELRAVPNAITIITAKELQDRGITQITDLFRGDVPGLFTPRIGQKAEEMMAGQVFGVQSRGMTYLGTALTPGEGIKTYVDGIELADKMYLGTIDPKSIERIEIVTGPQAATLYGSNAVNGVIQIFTKRGGAARPQVSVQGQSSWTQNNFSSSLAPNHDASVSLNGVSGRVSYNAGVTWLYTGSWTPGILAQTFSGYTGVNITTGSLMSDLSVRTSKMDNRNSSGGNQVSVIGKTNGTYGVGSIYSGHSPAKTYNKTLDNSVGATETYTPWSWWSHTLTLGFDHLTPRGSTPLPRNSVPSDTLSTLFIRTANRLTASYNTTVNVPLTSIAHANVLIGMDESQQSSQVMGGSYKGYPGGGFGGNFSYSERREYEHGGFLQGQLALLNTVYFTYGLRAVYNPNVGSEQNPHFEPTSGLAMSRDFGVISMKLRGSYGHATRPPDQGGLMQSVSLLEAWGPDVVSWFDHGDSVDARFANPELLPEEQHGGEVGLDLFVDTWGTLSITRYNQTVNNLIYEAVVDSVHFNAAGVTANPYCISMWQSGCYITQTQFLNLGSIRNEGWTGNGMLNLGPFTINGAYTLQKSRIIGITPRYQRQFAALGYVPGAAYDLFPEHTYAVGVTYVHGGTGVRYNLQGEGLVTVPHGSTKLYALGQGYRLGVSQQPLIEIPWTYREKWPGVPLGELHVSQQLTRRFVALLDIDNIANTYATDYNAVSAQSGRRTTLGFRLTL